jgi:hypothetical protein
MNFSAGNALTVAEQVRRRHSAGVQLPSANLGSTFQSQ